MFLDYINKYKKSQFIDRTIDVIEGTYLDNILITKPNVYFIGSWNSAFACKTDLLNKSFNFYPNQLLAKLFKMLNSNNPATVEEGKKYRNYLLRETNKYIKFIGYQALVNMCFPNLFQKLIQNPDILLEQWLDNNLDIDPVILNEFRNCFIVVDEVQRLYSSGGLNSYGITVMILHKHAKEYNIKFLFLTGTIINSVLAEITAIANIVSDSKEFIKIDDWTDKEQIMFNGEPSNMYKYKIKPDKEQEIIDLFYNKMFFYNPADEVTNKLPVLTKDSEYIKLTFPEKTNYPIEQHIGNCIIEENEMVVMKLKVEGIQAERYMEYLESASAEDDDDIIKTSILPQDAGLPLKESEYIKNGIIRTNNLLVGSFLKLENIRNYSIIGYWTFKLALENALKNEKTIIYHIKLNGFGLYQYAEILDYNGFVRYDSSIKSNSICKRCGKLFSDHSKPLNEKIKNKICNDFCPIVYAFLTGDVNQTERDELVNNVYNSPQNANGDIICVMFVSDVAYSGVSFLNTNNMFILSRIPNMSKWKQIAARIIRNKSHSLIKNKLAKIYTFIIYHESEKGISLGEKYYKLRIMYAYDSNTFLKRLSENTIGNVILNNISKYHMDNSEFIRLVDLLNVDMNRCLENVIDEIFKEDSNIWIIDNLINRIQSDAVSIAPLNLVNLSSDYIVKYIFSSQLHIFRYKNPIKGCSDVYVAKDINIIDNDIYQLITYSQFQSVAFEERNLKILINKLYDTTKLADKTKLIGDIIKNANKKLHLLKSCDIFWKTVFEVHNEYYESDEENFFYNHIDKNRNISKMAGMYYDDSIILKDGTKKPIKFTFIDFNGFSNKKYLYRITCFVTIASNPFYLNVMIEPKVKKQVKDLRKIERNLQCISIKPENLIAEFPELANESNKKEYCRKLISIICEYQYNHPDEKGVLSPFEK